MGRGRGGGVTSGRSYCKGEILGIRLILAGRAGNHLVERTHFHRYAFSWNTMLSWYHRVASEGASRGVFCRGATYYQTTYYVSLGRGWYERNTCPLYRIPPPPATRNNIRENTISAEARPTHDLLHPPLPPNTLHILQDYADFLQGRVDLYIYTGK